MLPSFDLSNWLDLLATIITNSFVPQAFNHNEKNHNYHRQWHHKLNCHHHSKCISQLSKRWRFWSVANNGGGSWLRFLEIFWKYIKLSKKKKKRLILKLKESNITTCSFFFFFFFLNRKIQIHCLCHNCHHNWQFWKLKKKGVKETEKPIDWEWTPKTVGQPRSNVSSFFFIY